MNRRKDVGNNIHRPRRHERNHAINPRSESGFMRGPSKPYRVILSRAAASAVADPQLTPDGSSYIVGKQIGRAVYNVRIQSQKQRASETTEPL
jgi:hypothetical protein